MSCGLSVVAPGPNQFWRTIGRRGHAAQGAVVVLDLGRRREARRQRHDRVGAQRLGVLRVAGGDPPVRRRDGDDHGRLALHRADGDLDHAAPLVAVEIEAFAGDGVGDDAMNLGVEAELHRPLEPAFIERGIVEERRHDDDEDAAEIRTVEHGVPPRLACQRRRSGSSDSC